MVAGSYVPELGDLVWLSVMPGLPGEKAGRRAALVLSPRIYNEASGLAVACPIVSQIKGYPFEVRLPRAAPVTGAVLADQMASVNWRASNAEYCGRAGAEVVERVQEHLPALLGL